MDKCREEFEVVARKNGWNLTTYPEITGRIDYVNVLTEQAWQMFQHQQAKVEELEKEWLEMNQQQEQAVKECFEVNAENRKLQKRVEWLEDRLKATDTLSKMRAAVIGSFKTQEFNARTRRKMMILKRAEQTLKVGKN
ncbi:hypothetical protein MSC38_01160 [Acinetobacter baumannii]|uniref:hypothetical protein n=1 Tax=Acinetobacter baumannii TaxID=470 RepID=UPI002940D2FE|nr:hypothetical protein [Acinetobacter baumannii]MDV4226916.1 hypothetical protein [Acinetobacter baumannii]